MLCERLISGQESISIIGLGYVGMPLAAAFAEKARVIGFDTNAEKIGLYLSGSDPTKELGDEKLRRTTVQFTSDETKLRDAKFHIVAVPTPVNQDKTPNLTSVINASRLVGRNLAKGSIVVFESTVYPGVTEKVCVPALEESSGLQCGLDFKVGYSPERINPGDRLHRLESICKVVSGMDAETLEEIANVYGLIIKAGVYKASSIKTAEAIKVAENSQRDINIAFMNELAMVFDRMQIDTAEVLEGMNTKWNALGFHPGLVGGHCIGVDPYYFTYEAERLGYHSQIILSGRKINDGMAQFVADAIIKKLSLTGKRVKDAKVVILGITFKPNCPDIRNSKVSDIIADIKEYGITPIVSDPLADPSEARRAYGVELTPLERVEGADCVVLAVAHDKFRAMSLYEIGALFHKTLPNRERILIDIYAILDKKQAEKESYVYWRL